MVFVHVTVLGTQFLAKQEARGLQVAHLKRLSGFRPHPTFVPPTGIFGAD